FKQRYPDEEAIMTGIVSRTRQEAQQEGRQEGRQNTQVQTLLRQIERKFGAEAREAVHVRVERGTPAELEMWLDRIIDAEQVEDVFREQ
ncbi:MAG: hypothetical protein ACLFSI_02675, partial [Halorhodospira sp.]